MSKKISLCLWVLIATALAAVGAYAQSATPLAPGSIQVSRVSYDGNTVGETFPAVFTDPSITGVQGSIWIDQFSSVPLAASAGSLSLPATGTTGNITTSFSSKSEGALMLSPNGQYLTYMGYNAVDKISNVSNSYSTNCFWELNPTGAGPFYDREAAIIGATGLIGLYDEGNAYSGDNPRAAITVDGTQLFMAGNADSTEYTASSGTPICGQTSGTFGPGLTIGARLDSNLTSPPDTSVQLGIYLAADRPDENAKKHVKDNNWRGIGIYSDASNNQNLYVAKGSGGNGDDGVFWVQNGTDSGLPSGTSNTIVPLFSAPATNPTTGAASPYTPFGFWFANPTTLYVADEGYPNTDSSGNLIPDPLAGLQKWSLVNGTWTLLYTIQAGLNLLQPQTIAGYPDTTYPYGIRNMTGWNNGDGSATIYAITAQYSAVSGGEPDPTSLVGITDSIAATTLPANEQFVTIQNSGAQQVYRGVAFIPPAQGTTRQTQTINFASVGPLTFGVSPVTLQGTSSSGWPTSFQLISGPGTLAGNVLTITGAGSIVIEADQSGNTDYAPASTQQTITVNPETPTIGWPAPSPITYGTALSGAQLDASTNVTGSFAYNPPAGTVLNGGLQTLSVTFTPTDTTDYTTATGSVTLQVNPASQTISFVKAPPASAVYGTSFGVAATASSGLTVAFGAAGSCSVVDNGDGTATYTMTSGSGACSVLASQAGNSNYSAASTQVSVSATKATATVTLSNLTQIYSGSPLTPTAVTSPVGLNINWTGAPQTNAGSYPVTATINDANYAGSVSGTFVINKAAATVTLSNLAQTYTGSPLTPTATTSPSGLGITWTGAPDTAAGTYTAKATVNDPNYSGSASGTFVISKATTTATLVPSSNPSLKGQTITFTVTIAPQFGGSPLGPVNFAYSNGTVNLNLGEANLNNGTASVAASNLPFGNGTVTASYVGDSNFKGSTGTVAQVVLALTTTLLKPSLNPAVIGQPVTLTAKVTSSPKVTGGTVNFYDGTQLIGSAAVSSQTAAVTVSFSTNVVHSLTAQYVPGTLDFTPSTSAVVNEKVQATTTTTVTSSLNPSPVGQAVVFTATVLSSSGVPTGSVTFEVDGTSVGTKPLGGGVAQIKLSNLTTGSHTVTATFKGSTSYQASSGTITQVVQ